MTGDADAITWSGWVSDLGSLAAYLAPVRLARFAVSTADDLVVTPTWFDLVDDRIRTTVAASSRKARLLARGARAALVVDDDLDRVRGLMIAGQVTRTSTDHDEVLSAHCRRYVGAEGEAWLSAFRGARGFVAHIRIETVRSWDRPTRLRIAFRRDLTAGTDWRALSAGDVVSVDWRSYPERRWSRIAPLRRHRITVGDAPRHVAVLTNRIVECACSRRASMSLIRATWARTR